MTEIPFTKYFPLFSSNLEYFGMKESVTRSSVMRLTCSASALMTLW